MIFKQLYLNHKENPSRFYFYSWSEWTESSDIERVLFNPLIFRGRTIRYSMNSTDRTIFLFYFKFLIREFFFFTSFLYTFSFYRFLNLFISFSHHFFLLFLYIFLFIFHVIFIFFSRFFFFFTSFFFLFHVTSIYFFFFRHVYIQGKEAKPGIF